jgi:hypothetical protein
VEKSKILIKSIISLNVILYFLSSVVSQDNMPLQGGNKKITSLFKAGTDINTIGSLSSVVSTDNVPLQGGNKKITSLFKAGTDMNTICSLIFRNARTRGTPEKTKILTSQHLPLASQALSQCLCGPPGGQK